MINLLSCTVALTKLYYCLQEVTDSEDINNTSNLNMSSPGVDVTNDVCTSMSSQLSTENPMQYQESHDQGWLHCVATFGIQTCSSEFMSSYNIYHIHIGAHWLWR